MVGPHLQAEVDGIVVMVRKLSEGVGPKAEGLVSYNQFYKKVAGLLGNFLRHDYQVTKGKKVTTQNASGILAIEWKMGEVKIKLKRDDTLDPKELKSLRIYDWLLTPDQRVLRETWLFDALKQQSLLCTTSPLHVKDGDADVAVSAGSASSSGSKGGLSKMLALMSSTVGVVPEARVAKKKRDDNDEDISKFFTKRTRA
jgi:hypothetical protein